MWSRGQMWVEFVLAACRLSNMPIFALPALIFPATGNGWEMASEAKQNKNIVALSDSTGNGAAKTQKANVLRLYRALDLHEDRQVAFCDDGVGSREDWISKVLGAAFRLVLKRKVLEIFKFFCRNYRAASVGGEPDRVFLFGFSHGAFTVRVLASFIYFVVKLTGRIGSKGDEALPIGARSVDYTPESSGRLHLYANDAVMGFLPKWDYFYYSASGRNQGRVDFEVRCHSAIPLPMQNFVVETRSCRHGR